MRLEICNVHFKGSRGRAEELGTDEGLGDLQANPLSDRVDTTWRGKSEVSMQNRGIFRRLMETFTRAERASKIAMR